MGEKIETMGMLLRRNRFISVQDKVRVIEGAILPGILYGTEMTLNMTETRMRKIDTQIAKFARIVLGLPLTTNQSLVMRECGMVSVREHILYK